MVFSAVCCNFGTMAEIGIGGIEGGATHSTITILNTSGQILCRLKGPGTNHFLTGMEECQRRIAQMVDEAKKEAKIPQNQPLKALGLSLSGCEMEETNNLLVKGLKKTYPNLSENYAIGSDTIGSVLTASNKGGIVCIAGTGSNTLLINPDGSTVQCGGWGFLLGDQGSAWKVAHASIKYCFNDLDNFEKAPYPITKVWEIIKDHFNIKAQAEILDAYYTKFDKAFIAQICKKLSVLAKEGDALAKHVFEEAGQDLAKMIGAVIPKASKELFSNADGIHIVCVGSVWLSWDLLEPGFMKWFKEHVKNVNKMSLMKLTTTMAVGAAYMAADKAKVKLERDYTKNYSVFYKYTK